MLNYKNATDQLSHAREVCISTSTCTGSAWLVAGMKVSLKSCFVVFHLLGRPDFAGSNELPCWLNAGVKNAL